ncbi:MAG TPA: YggS family pyridoxal phosphate-dependent enzyme, partial [Propionibacteriaceae bacterium]|nr:YggS family pyridoxal phosphate-dependent enzyme [Propionibacteriaceae bacterium]
LIQRQLREQDLAPGSYDELSMGMSNDFELAIAYGATTVRVGQAIFGPRE